MASSGGDDRFRDLKAFVCIGHGSSDGDDVWEAVMPNGQMPMTIRGCDWFEGSALLLLRTPEDPEGDVYQTTVFGPGRRRMFELQIQGQFSWPKVPGPLFVGGELTSRRMHLSGLARLATRGALAFVKTAAGAGSLSYSFGDETTHDAPHITAPLFSSMPAAAYDMDHTLGTPSTHLETATDRRIRKSDPDLALKKAQTSHGVTLSLNSAVVDARHWSAKLPGLPGLDLHRLWEDADLLISFYALGGIDGGDYAACDNVPHSRHRKHYFFKLKLRHEPHHTSSSSSSPHQHHQQATGDRGVAPGLRAPPKPPVAKPQIHLRPDAIRSESSDDVFFDARETEGGGTNLDDDTSGGRGPLFDNGDDDDDDDDAEAQPQPQPYLP